MPVAASSRDQAVILYQQAEGFVMRTPALYEERESAILKAKGKRKTTVPRFLCLEGFLDLPVDWRVSLQNRGDE